MATCDKYKVTWFGRPVPNIFAILNIFNLPPKIFPFMEEGACEPGGGVRISDGILMARTKMLV